MTKLSPEQIQEYRQAIADADWPWVRRFTFGRLALRSWPVTLDALEDTQREVDRLRASELGHRQRNDELRQAVLSDPDHDNDTINWALDYLDDYLVYTQAAEAVKEDGNV